MTGTPSVDTEQRRAELAANLAMVEARIVRACDAAGRARDEVTLVVVTKTRPASDVRLLAGLGVVDVGENRDQEAARKAGELTDLDLRWHLVGRLQTNKCRSVATYADVVHTIDRARLVRTLGRAAQDAGREILGLVQVSLDGDPARGGAPVDDVLPLADLVAATEGLALGGVMAVAPLGADPAEAFERLAVVARAVRVAHPRATVISAGMSGDLEEAVAAGATQVRVGTAVLGHRPPLG